MCVQRIKKKFSKMDSIREINVNLDNKIVQIQTKDGQIITDDQINEVIKEAGYNVANIERE
jgi:copper chaperone CopZ